MRDPSDSEDLSHVEAFLAGDENAFRALFDKYREKVYRIAFRFVRNKDDALEVTQEVFLRVYLSLKSFQTNSKFFTWLYRIAVNRSIDFSRSRRHDPTTSLDAVESSQTLTLGRHAQRSTPSPGELAQARELEELVAQAIEQLSPKHRAVFVLHASENLSYRQIADVLGCNIGTVMSRLFYARKRLREELTRLGYALDEIYKKDAEPDDERGDTE